MHLFVVAVVLRGGRRKRLADPLGPAAAAVADVAAGATVTMLPLRLLLLPGVIALPLRLHLLVHHLITLHLQRMYALLVVYLM